MKDNEFIRINAKLTKKEAEEFKRYWKQTQKEFKGITQGVLISIALDLLYEQSNKVGFKKLYIEHLTEQLKQDNTTRDD